MSYRKVMSYLTPNKYSRPQIKVKKMKGIVIHWVANPNTTAKNNRGFFESRMHGLKGYGSAHEIIDLNGDVWILLPNTEMAYHVGSSQPYMKAAIERLSPYPNDCTYGIECTHIDWAGRMSPATYETLVQRTADVCGMLKLNPLSDIWLHKEVVGWKDCHRWFVDNPHEWKLFKQRVNDIVNPKEGAEPEMKKADADKIISYLKGSYSRAPQREEREEIARLADVVRECSGQPKQNS